MADLDAVRRDFADRITAAGHELPEACGIRGSPRKTTADADDGHGAIGVWRHDSAHATAISA